MNATLQIAGEMVVTNTERLNDPRYDAYGDMFKAMMDNNLMEFRLLKGGIADLSFYGPASRTRLTSKVFVESLKGLMASANISELALDGSFMLIETGTGLEPTLTKVTVDKSRVTSHEAALTWNMAA